MDQKNCNYCKVVLPIYKFSINRKDEYNKSCDECRLKQKTVRENNKCEHNKQKTRCKECGGASICKHNREKSQCKDCGGSSICEHNKRKSNCKECGGSSICKHNKRKSRCKDCGGTGICKHNRQKSSCKECGGSSICEHNIHKSNCKQCGGSGICEHNKHKSNCKECKNPIKITIINWIKSSKESDKKHNRYDADHFIDKCFLEGLVEEYPACYYEDCKINLQYVKYQNDLATIERINNNIGHIKSNCVICCLKCNQMRKSKKTTN